MVKNKLFVAIPALYLLLSFSLMYVLSPAAVSTLTAEDHVIEYLGALAFLLASILFFLTGAHLVRTKTQDTALHKGSYFALALLFFGGAGEEISWGQRILGIETPESLKQVNVQGETTIHNLVLFQGQGALPIDIEELFGLFSLFVTLLVPLSAHFVELSRRFFAKFMPIFPWVFGCLFAGNWALAKLGGTIYRAGADVPFTASNVVELKESNYGVLFAVIALFMYTSIVRNFKRKATIPLPETSPPLT